MSKDTLCVVEASKLKGWDEFVHNHPWGNIFQTPEMHDVYKRTRNYEPIALAVLDESDCIQALTQAVVIKEIGGMIGAFTARAVMQGGPLWVEGEKGQAAVRMLMEHYDKVIGKKALYTEIRNMRDTGEISDILRGRGYEYEEHLNFLIDLNKNRDGLWNGLSKSRRNGITKGNRLGMIVEEAEDIDSIHQIYNILQATYSYAKLPLADKSLFESVLEVLLPKNMAKFWIVKKDGKIIGTMLTFIYKDVIYDWYAGALRSALKYCPNDVLTWQVIECCAENKFNIFDFGGAGKPNEEYGVREFKKQFGGRLVNFGRYKKIHHRLTTNLAETGFELYRKVFI